MPNESFRTYHADQALQLSELVNLQFARVRYGTTDPRLIRMREPDGPSTDAGRKARQPLMLVRNSSEETGVVFGFVDLFKRTADLRSYPVLAQQHEQRFGTPLTVGRAEYTRLLEELKAFLKSQAIESRIVGTLRGNSAVSSMVPVAPGPFQSPLIGRLTTPIALRVLALIVSAAVGFGLCYLLCALGVLPV